MHPEHAHVIDQIRAAFPAHPISADGAFTDWGGTYSDVQPYMDQLEGKTWQALDREYITRRADALGFLGTRHLAAVLPAYLSALVEDGVFCHAADMLMLILAKPGPDKQTGIKSERFDALAGTLTDAQRAAVATALRAFAETDEGGSLGTAARAALDGYWTQYLRVEA